MTAILSSCAIRAEASEEVSLGWVRGNGAESCASPRAIASAVEQLLGGKAFVAPSKTEAAIEAVVVATNGGWRAEIRTIAGDGKPLGQRTIEVSAASCDALTVPATLAIALLVNPDARPAAPPASPIEAALPATKEAPRPEMQCPPAAPRERSIDERSDIASSRMRVELDAGLAPGLLPGAAPFARLELHILPAPRWEILVGGSFFPSRSVQLRPSVTADLSLALAEVSLCRTLLASEWLRVGPCSGLALGVLGARGQGFVRAESHDDFEALGALSLRAAATSRRSGLFVALEAGVAVPFVRNPYQFSDERGVTEGVFQAAPVTGRFAFGAGVSFP